MLGGRGRRLEGFTPPSSMSVRSLGGASPRRSNAVSPPWVKETLVKLGMDPALGLSAADVAKAYVAAVRTVWRSSSGKSVRSFRFAKQRSNFRGRFRLADQESMNLVASCRA